MPEISIALIRRKAEHNEGLIHTLEELSLHQEELESINDTLGCNCRRLKILYLQNNIIGRMKNLHHMKELEYLNLALNNISKVEGLDSCEFLNKLDLTVNFVDMDELESSVSAMEGNRHLKDLYMMGNPCQSWEGFEAYVIGRLPQLERLDGKEVTRTDRIRAQQRLPSLRAEIPRLAEEVRRRKREEKHASNHVEGKAEALHSPPNRDGREEGREGDHARRAPRKTDGDSLESDNGGVGGGGGGDEERELTKHTPEVRTAIYRKMAEQKKEKDDRQKENLPKDRNVELEQEEAIARARKREEEGVIRQCNEGKLSFRFEETRATPSSNLEEVGRGRGRGDIVLEVAVPRYLDSSLIDLDVHPHYVSIVIKGKVLRLSLQAEVKAGEAKARRSKTTGSLVVTMPKVDAEQSLGLLPTSSGRRAPGVVADRAAVAKSAKANDVGRTKRRVTRAKTMAELMMEEAMAAGGARKNGEKPGDSGDGSGDSKLALETPRKAVSIRGMVGPRHGGLALEEEPLLSEVASTKRPGTKTNDRNMTIAAAPECAPTATSARAVPRSALLPTPPNDSRESPRMSSEPKMPSRIAEIVPPAPPVGCSVSVGGEGTGVTWPRGEDKGGEVVVGLGGSYLDDVD